MRDLFQAPRRRSSGVAVLVSLLLIIPLGSLAVSQVAAPATKPKTEAAADPLVSLTNMSRVLYTLAKQKALEHPGPVMIVVGDDMVLRNGQKRLQARFIPDIYHTLKTFDHIALTIDVTLAAQGDGAPIPEDVLHDLRELPWPIFASRPGTNCRVRAGSPNSASGRKPSSMAVLSSSTRSSSSGNARPRRRIHFTRRMTPLMMANAAAAARAALDSLHHQVMAWKADLTPEEWSKLTVLVIGRQLPRKDNLAVQYFARVLGESGEGKRIIFAEGLGEEPRALDLLATYRVDTQVGIDFFNDPSRMTRDLLADAARDYLPLLCDENPVSLNLARGGTPCSAGTLDPGPLSACGSRSCSPGPASRGSRFLSRKPSPSSSQSIPVNPGSGPRFKRVPPGIPCFSFPPTWPCATAWGPI